MQETEKSSSRHPLTVEQLLQLKRLEKPAPEFWAGFERDLQQKQLQALVRPSRWEKARAALVAPRSILAPLSATAVIGMAAIAIGLSFYAFANEGPKMTGIEKTDPYAETILLADAAIVAGSDAEAAAPEADVSPRPPKSLFVVDALVPEARHTPLEPFRIEAVAEALIASDSSSYYVVNAFTTAVPHDLGAMDAAFEF